VRTVIHPSAHEEAGEVEAPLPPAFKDALK
jgi:hypothetical protein